MHSKGDGRRKRCRDGYREHHFDVFIQTVKRTYERQQACQNVENDDEGDGEDCQDTGEGNAPRDQNIKLVYPFQYVAHCLPLMSVI